MIIFKGPIAFKTEADGFTVVRHPNGKVCVIHDESQSQPVLDEERCLDHSETWKDMEAQVMAGNVHSIGIQATSLH